MSVVQLSGAPDLLEKGETGEYKFGTFAENGENYNVVSYGRVVRFSREMIINDDLRAFDKVLAGFGGSASRLENRLVYAQLAGAITLSDGVALFHANRGNLAGAGGVIAVNTLSDGRKAMRKQKGLAGEELNITPTYLILPSDLETVGNQYTSAGFVSAKPSDVNDFRQGGRSALTPIVDSVLDGYSATAWFLATDDPSVDTIEYCYLDGNEGVYLDSMLDFHSDGFDIKARLDFAAKAVDGKGLYKNPGA
jgi:hypothetical protein